MKIFCFSLGTAERKSFFVATPCVAIRITYDIDKYHNYTYYTGIMTHCFKYVAVGNNDLDSPRLSPTPPREDFRSGNNLLEDSRESSVVLSETSVVSQDEFDKEALDKILEAKRRSMVSQDELDKKELDDILEATRFLRSERPVTFSDATTVHEIPNREDLLEQAPSIASPLQNFFDLLKRTLAGAESLDHDLQMGVLVHEILYAIKTGDDIGKIIDTNRPLVGQLEEGLGQALDMSSENGKKVLATYVYLVLCCAEIVSNKDKKLTEKYLTLLYRLKLTRDQEKIDRYYTKLLKICGENAKIDTIETEAWASRCVSRGDTVNAGKTIPKKPDLWCSGSLGEIVDFVETAMLSLQNMDNGCAVEARKIYKPLKKEASYEL